MQTTQSIDFRCPSCGTPSRATATTIIDPTVNPAAKADLLSGTLNVIQCPACGTPSTAATPLLYHDATKELLITFVPMALGMSDQDADKFLGRMMNEVTSNMDQKLIKSYIFQPRRALTMQGFVEQILESDGVTKEMQEAQRERVRLVQMFLQTDPDTLPALITEHDERIDDEFFTTMSVIAQQTMQQGRPDMAEHIMTVQQVIAEQSTVGKQLIQRAGEQQAVIEEVATALQSLDQSATPADLVALVRPHAGDMNRLQAFVGLARPIFDYAFFQELTVAVDAATGDDKTQLEGLRDDIMQLTQMIDQQQQMEMQAAVDLLRQMLSNPDPEAAVRANMSRIDDTFMSVLELNIQEAEKAGDVGASTRLKALQGLIVAALQANMRPDVRFINDLLSAPTEADALTMIKAQAAGYGPELLETFDALVEVIGAQSQPQLVERLQALKAAAKDVLDT